MSVSIPEPGNCQSCGAPCKIAHVPYTYTISLPESPIQVMFSNTMIGYWCTQCDETQEVTAVREEFLVEVALFIEKLGGDSSLSTVLHSRHVDIRTLVAQSPLPPGVEL